MTSKVLFSLHFQEGHILTYRSLYIPKLLMAINVRTGLFVIGKHDSIYSENISSVSTIYFPLCMQVVPKTQYT